MNPAAARKLVAHYIAMGLAPVPIPFKGKAPVIDDWPILRIKTPEKLPKGRFNVGIILGQASGGLICVDLDDADAVELAPQFLPPTGMVVGRKEVPRSHWMYRVSGDFRKWEFKHKPTRQKFIEILGDGQQVVVGPSVHPTGDVYDDLTGEAAEISPDELVDAVRQLFYTICDRKGLDPHEGEHVDKGLPVYREYDPQRDGLRPGDDYNARGDVRGLLQKHDWKPGPVSKNREYWTRPGKQHGISATLMNGRALYVFTSSTELDSDRAYGPFSLFAHLEHNGDFHAAAMELFRLGYGTRHERNGNGGDFARRIAAGSGEWTMLGESTIPELPMRTAAELITEFPKLREPVIDGLIRRGETMNIIAASKVGKSWLSMGLGLAVSSGRQWLGRFSTKLGRVLIVDNELHPETSASRLPWIAQQLGIPPEEYGDRLIIANVRGLGFDLITLSGLLAKMQFDLIILDAWYRFLPVGCDENSNGDVTKLYNLLDRVARATGSAFVAIHHTSKGSQSGKSVTDVGAGAGAQSRAPDAHLTIRPHQEDGAAVVESAVRSFPPMEPFCLRWNHPVWVWADDLDPKQLKQERQGRAGTNGDGASVMELRKQKDDALKDKLIKTFRLFLDGETANKIKAAAGLSGQKFNLINSELLLSGLVVPCKVRKNNVDYDGFKMVSIGRSDDSDKT